MYIHHLLYWYLLVCILFGCTHLSQAQQNTKKKQTMHTSSLAQQLEDSGYRQLFLTGKQKGAKEIWQEGKNKNALEKLLADENTSLYAQFLAIEILRRFKVDVDSKHNSQLAKAYTYALKHSSADQKKYSSITGNAWGLLYEEDHLGHLGKQMVALGKSAIPELVKLLDNNHGKILYEGSEEATIGNGYQYRIKDFAAFYLSKITQTPITFYQDLAKRDAEIERFKKALPKN